MDYIHDNRHLLRGRSQVVRHGDYHVGNLILMPDHGIGVVDFDQCTSGETSFGQLQPGGNPG